MSQARVAAVLALSLALLGAASSAAETFTVKLTNGTSFETRYQPKAAAWDPSMITFINETGNLMALPKAMVSEVSSDLENRGFGRVINTTTIDLGFLANDLPEDTAAQPGQQLAPREKSYDIQQFVEPGATGGGVPVGGLGFSGGSAQSYVAPPPAAPAAPAAEAAPAAANPQ